MPKTVSSVLYLQINPAGQAGLVETASDIATLCPMCLSSAAAFIHIQAGFKCTTVW